MIIPLNIKKENTYYKIFEAFKIAFSKLNSNMGIWHFVKLRYGQLITIK